MPRGVRWPEGTPASPPAGLEITGAPGVLLRLRRLGLASRDLEDDLRMLEEADMRLSPELRRAVLDNSEAEEQSEGQ